MSNANKIPDPERIIGADNEPDGTYCIISGSRSAVDVLSTNRLIRLINTALKALDINPDIIVSGTAKGVDKCGEQWAKKHDVPIAQFPAPWNDIENDSKIQQFNNHGKFDPYAGIRRNQWMATYTGHHGNPGTLLAIYDRPSNGTESMIEQAKTQLPVDQINVIPIGSNRIEATREYRKLVPKPFKCHPPTHNLQNFQWEKAE